MKMTIVADSGRTLADMFADGRFYHVNPDITEEHFPLTGEVAPVWAMQTMSHKDLGCSIGMKDFEIKDAYNRRFFRSATLYEQLAYAKAKWNGKDTVVALGSFWPDPFSVPVLYDGFRGRHLLLRQDISGINWLARALFLVVRMGAFT